MVSAVGRYRSQVGGCPAVGIVGSNNAHNRLARLVQFVCSAHGFALHHVVYPRLGDSVRRAPASRFRDILLVESVGTVLACVAGVAGGRTTTSTRSKEPDAALGRAGAKTL
jgi:hypothetical protein